MRVVYLGSNKPWHCVTGFVVNVGVVQMFSLYICTPSLRAGYPSLNSKTGWIGVLWSMTNLL